MNLFWLVRMRRWAQNPPSWRRVVLVVAVIVFCLALAALELVFGWPDWLTVTPIGRGGRF
ncbi:hypothetical protein DZD18_14410 [Rhodobacteraceae bacterium W635]|uniref:hypothetical protein n=1 Tax=Nioella halotolerans TaxID=2303578 RepID=UPI000E3D0D25|nr:hypothetical protein DZD18_14410 [Rhodobacteraceae bacterium W635]